MQKLRNTADFSVKFNKTVEMGLEPQKAFPFIYSMVNANDVTWNSSLSKTTGAYLRTIGPTVGANASLTWPVKLDPDYNYKLLGIKYSVYKWFAASSIYIWYDNVFNNMLGLGQDIDEERNYGTPLTNYIDITLSFEGSGSRIVYGGQDPNSIVNGRGRLPLPVSTIQGYDYGQGQIRTPFLLPREGALIFDITNRYNEALTVAAAVYGLKIRL